MLTILMVSPPFALLYKGVIMYKKLTVAEQLRNEQSKNNELLGKVAEQEIAIFELARIISESQNVETVSE